MVALRLRGPLRALAGGHADHTLEPGTVAELLRELERRYPDLGGWVLDERGLVRRHINVFVNGERVTASTPVHPGDRVELVPAITGG